MGLSWWLNYFFRQNWVKSLGLVKSLGWFETILEKKLGELCVTAKIIIICPKELPEESLLEGLSVGHLLAVNKIWRVSYHDVPWTSRFPVAFQGCVLSHMETLRSTVTSAYTSRSCGLPSSTLTFYPPVN